MLLTPPPPSLPIHSKIHTVVLVVTSYSGTPLRAVESAEARLRSDVSGTMKEEGVYYLGAGACHNVLCVRLPLQGHLQETGFFFFFFVWLALLVCHNV